MSENNSELQEPPTKKQFENIVENNEEEKKEILYVKHVLTCHFCKRSSSLCTKNDEIVTFQSSIASGPLIRCCKCGCGLSMDFNNIKQKKTGNIEAKFLPHECYGSITYRITFVIDKIDTWIFHYKNVANKEVLSITKNEEQAENKSSYQNVQHPRTYEGWFNLANKYNWNEIFKKKSNKIESIKVYKEK